MYFFEVFPTISVKDKEIRSIFETTEIVNIVGSNIRKMLYICFRSNHLIKREKILKMEGILNKEIAKKTGKKTSLKPTYNLSEQYNLENLYSAIEECILSEIKEDSEICFQVLYNAKVKIEGMKIEYTLAEGCVYRAKESEIRDFVQLVFQERFGYDIEITFEYEEEKTVNRKSPEEFYNKKMEIYKEDIKAKKEETAAQIKEEEMVKEPGTSSSPLKNQPPKQRSNYRRLPDDPSILYGRNFDGDSIPICDIIDEIGEVVIRGKLVAPFSRPIRNDKTIITFVLTDFTDSIKCKIYARTEQAQEIIAALKPGNFYLLKGIASMDTFEKDITIGSLVGIKSVSDFTSKREDNAEVKRVELHTHTLMSDLDAVVDVGSLIHRAFEWGHPAIAITDHGVVQAFPDTLKALKNLKVETPEDEQRAKDFKVIYGMEGYIVDDLVDVVTNSKNQDFTDSFVVFDVETTGLNNSKDKITEIGAVKISNGKIIDEYGTLVNPQVPIPFKIEKLTNISDHMVMDAPLIKDVLGEFLEFCEGSALVAHNANFDMGFISKNAKDLGIDIDFTAVDTVALSRMLLPRLGRHRLNIIAKELNIPLENHHRATDDARATAQIFLKFIDMLKDSGVTDLNGINKIGRLSDEAVKKLPSNHIIILAQNEIGRVNLYKLVSMSHLQYFHRTPKIPKSVLMEYREGLIIGSACEAGEVYRAISGNKSAGDIEKIVKFYDYLEIQPLANNEFMLRNENSGIESEKDLIKINKKIISLGKQYNKPVVATCDVHFLEPEDEIYRRVIMSGKGFKDADSQPPLYLRTTDEMLEEFNYLHRDIAYEVVVENPRKIADMVEKISPLRKDNYPPVMANADEDLRRICYEKAVEIYGENLPKPVHDRLEHELKSIISNGFSVMYIIAQKLVWKSIEEGYLVGSRGSVGSSFVATMAGITEVNPLSPHYYCTNCFYSDFDSEDVREYVGASGCDMPDKNCPKCETELVKEGHDIPFETFLGFDGDKEPDIDLNFSGEYQSKAHEHTEVLFGEGYTFRAGTIGTLAEKTAFGYVKNYFDEREVYKRKVEIERILQGCVGVKRSTGQHPGGIVVLPHGEEIYSFTPIQRPANDVNSKITTTHFDYHSLEHNLLKLDILGHDDPTMIKYLEDFTGVDAISIPLDEKKVLSLFRGVEALGLDQDSVPGLELGCLGIPEFGTDFVMQMVKDTKPGKFSDLVRISGLSHGTDVWLNNAQILIQEGNCTLSTAICTRDDIMTFLMNEGMNASLSFNIMESVRRGRGLTPEMEESMIEANIPDWYIWSCKQIKYMFPKAHAAAYVMMAFRIAYFKVYHPLAYYASYFGIRASAFNYELMCLGRERLELHMQDYRRRSHELTKKEQDTYKEMRIVQEMYARGIKFMPLDIYTAKAKDFQIIEDKLMPSLSTIEGMGEKAADGVVESVKKGEFLSREDFKIRSRVSSTVVDKMSELGLLGDLPSTNQMSIMDLL